MDATSGKVENAPDAIRRAFEFFDEFFQRNSYSNALLEGVRYEDGQWIISIGFDLGSGSTVGGFAGLGERVEHRRVVRKFAINENDGALIQMT